MKKKEVKEIIRFSPTPETGLTPEQVQLRLFNKETNQRKEKSEKTYAQIIIENVFSFFNMLLVGIALLLLLVVGIETILNLTFILIGAVNTSIGIFQQIKSKNAIKRLKLLTDSKITVRRNGQNQEISQEDIVLDDVIILKQGDQIPVDGIVIANDYAEINESLLTGESRAVKKQLNDTVFAGSYVLSGTCMIRADKIGNDTYLSSIEGTAKGFKKPKSKLMISINRLVKILGATAIILAVLVFFNNIMRIGTENYKDAVKFACLTVSYMIPVGMMLLASVAMATGVYKLASKKVLAQDLYSVESLSRVDTLCLDKTGTLTDGTMIVEKALPLEGCDLEAIMSSFLGAFPYENMTAAALVKKYGKTPIYKATQQIPFSSVRKFSAVELGKAGTWMLGAPEYLTQDEDILKQCQEYTKDGLRVVLLTKIVWGKIADGEIEIKKTKDTALFVLRDNVRPEVPDTMKWFYENDVDIKIISGDNINTVSYIAKKSGIKDWNKAVDLSKITEDDDFEKIVMENSIFARVSPEQKAEIVKVLKKNGRTVAMTGDGINDLVALKGSDCSIALANGAPATKNIANLVLLDSNFANMKEAVFEGRRVVNNIRRSSTLFIMKDWLWFFVSLFPILIGVPHSLESTIMTAVNTFITGIGSLFLALEPDKSRIEGSFVRTVLTKSIIAGFFMFIPVLAAYVLSFIKCGLNPIEISNYMGNELFPVISLCITISGFIIFFNISRPFTKYRTVLFAVVLAMVVILFLAIPDFFFKNGTTYMKELLNTYDSFGAAIIGIWNNLFSFQMYSEFTTESWLFVGIFLALSSVFYLLSDKFVGKVLDKTVFSDKKFLDDD